jgi:hypothetical protein
MVKKMYKLNNTLLMRYWILLKKSVFEKFYKYVHVFLSKIWYFSKEYHIISRLHLIDVLLKTMHGVV